MTTLISPARRPVSPGSPPAFGTVRDAAGDGQRPCRSAGHGPAVRNASPRGRATTTTAEPSDMGRP